MSQIIGESLQSIESVTRSAQEIFGGLNKEQLNQRPDKDSWSIAQCFEHLIVTNSSYFPDLRKIISGIEMPTFWMNFPMLSRFFGRILKKSVSPDSARKLNATKVFEPSESELPEDIIQKFVKNQDELCELLSALEKTDTRQTKITSPAAKFVTYSLDDMMQILALHEERHLQQAIRTGKTLGLLK